MVIDTMRGHTPSARKSKISLSGHLKSLQQMQPFENEINRYIKDLTETEILFGSYTEPNIHSIFLRFPDGQYFVGVKNNNRNLLKLLPEDDIFYCDGNDTYRNGILGMHLDREEIKPDKTVKSFRNHENRKQYRNFIANTTPYKKTIKLEKITSDIKVKYIASNTLKIIAQEDYAVRLENCAEFKELLKKKNFTAFIL